MQAELAQTSPQVPFSANEDDRRFVLAVARKILKDDDAAADVAQEALLSAFRYKDSFRGESHYRTWLYRIATTAAISHLRRERSRSRHLVLMLDDEDGNAQVGTAAVDASPDTPEQQLDDAQTAAAVAVHLDALPQHYRSVLKMRLCDGASTHETASSLGISLATVKIRTFRARRLLQERLAASYTH
jgi:RNA polymerase sigma-70 factor, ECF subfamily